MQATMNLEEVARYLGVSRATIYNMLRDGRFAVPAIQGLNPRRWNVEDIDSWRKGV